ncbi:MAG TPA: TetR/AcrR family transcriptional regulator [Methylophilaceae bacterium]|jgi:AcrR family transcriptional regulator
MTGEIPKTLKRETYRHGDLYRTLLDAAVELARKGGKDAIVLREVTRQAGVAPNAAYRHFADLKSLLRAASMAAQAELATYMEKELAKITPSGDKVEDARAQLRAVGTGYLHFAQAEPGLFRLAFSEHADLSNATDPASTGSGGLTPFQILSVALDALMEAGQLPKERREAAEFFAWSAVHGLAMLQIDGPLRGLEAAQAEAIGQRLIDMVERGL